jgi:flagellar motor switch protein FliN/FliY
MDRLMSTEIQDPIEQVEQVVVAGASTLRERLGVPVTARDVQELSDAESGAPANGVTAALSTSTGVIAANGGGDELGVAGDADAIMAALVSGIAEAIGADAGADPGPVDSLQDAGVVDPVMARFELTVDGNAIPVVVAIASGVFTAPSTPTPDSEQTTVTRAPLPDLGSGNGHGPAGRDVTVLSDVTMKVTVQLGHTQLQVRDLLALREGSVVELDQQPGTPVDILVNGTPVARGDVVVVHDDLGVRITEVLGRIE